MIRISCSGVASMQLKWATASIPYSFFILEAISTVFSVVDPPAPYVTEIKSGLSFDNSSIVL